MNNTEVSISVVDGDIKLQSSKGQISAEFATFVKIHKSQLIEILDGEITVDDVTNTMADRLKKVWFLITDSVPSLDSNFLNIVTRSMEVLNLKRAIYDEFKLDIEVSSLFSNLIFKQQLTLIDKAFKHKQVDVSKAIDNKSTETDSLQDTLNNMAKKFNILGGHVARYSSGELKSYCVGHEDAKKSLELIEQRRYRVSCFAKVLTTYAALRLIDRGEFQLDTPLLHWVENMPHFNKNLTLRHLLSHTAGFDETAFWSIHKESSSLTEFVQNCLGYSESFEPGQEYCYGPSSSSIVAWLLETYTGLSWREVIEQEVTSPLGITLSDEIPVSTSFVRTNSEIGYEEELHEPCPKIVEPGGSTQLCLTTVDVAKIAAISVCRGRSIEGKQYISPMLAKMLEIPSTLVEGHYSISGFALGWLIFPHGLRGFITSSGGQHTCIVIDRGMKEVLVIQTNTYPNFEFFEEIIKFLYKQPILKSVGNIPDFSLDEVLGEYKADGLKAWVYRENNRVQLKVSFMDKESQWSEPVISTLSESGMGDYTAKNKVFPMTGSISFHDFEGSGEATHIRITHKLCKRINTGI